MLNPAVRAHSSVLGTGDQPAGNIASIVNSVAMAMTIPISTTPTGISRSMTRSVSCRGGWRMTSVGGAVEIPQQVRGQLVAFDRT